MSSSFSNGNTPDLELLFAAEREFASEPEEVRQRVIRKARAAVPYLAAGQVGSPSHATRWPLVAKAAAVVVVLAGVGATAYELGFRQRPESKVAVLTAVELAPSEPAELPVPALEPRIEETSPGPIAPKSAHRRGQAEDAYARELRLLRPAQQAVANGNFGRALGQVADHQRRFPHGKLSEEREILRVRALIGLHRYDDARAAAAAFRKRFPESAVHDRIQSLLDRGR